MDADPMVADLRAATATASRARRWPGTGRDGSRRRTMARDCRAGAVSARYAGNRIAEGVAAGRYPGAHARPCRAPRTRGAKRRPHHPREGTAGSASGRRHRVRHRRHRGEALLDHRRNGVATLLRQYPIGSAVTLTVSRDGPRCRAGGARRRSTAGARDAAVRRDRLGFHARELATRI